MVKLIAEKNYERLMRTVVEPGLAAMREEIDMPLSGGGTLHAEVYNRLDAERAVVILHGFTESAEKFRELSWYLINAGYSVFAIDHRGHGRSVRAMEDTSLTHVDCFDDYLRDLEAFMDRIVRPRMGGAPLYLYAHSMGGAIGALALMEHPDWFTRAVLNAPMIRPVTAGVPFKAAQAVIRAMCALGMGKKRSFLYHPFDPEREHFEDSHSTSRPRFDYYQNKRIANVHLQNCAPTNAWLREAMGVSARLLDPANDAKIQTPLLLIQAGLDSIVCLPEQERFVRQTPGAKICRFDDAKHEIYCNHDEVLAPYLETILDFYEGKE